jgi:hypothetical protein
VASNRINTHKLSGFDMTLLKDNFDFEFAYNQVVAEEHYTQEDRSALHEAVEGAYKKLDDTIRNYWRRDPQAARPLVSWHGFNDLLDNFASDKKAKGYLFTLNQDIFIERWHSDEKKHLRTVGMPLVSRPPDGKPLSWLRSGELTPNFYFQAPSDPKEDGESTSDLLHYVKLHGSMNWRSSDGRGLMVIGGDKLGQIQREPILKWYLKIFRDVLARSNRRLLVIGYGLRDLHINEVIADSIREYGLKLYVISPVRPKDFREMLHCEDDKAEKILEDKKTLWKGLTGYWDWELKDVCPVSDNHVSEEIRRVLFQS